MRDVRGVVGRGLGAALAGVLCAAAALAEAPAALAEAPAAPQAHAPAAAEAEGPGAAQAEGSPPESQPRSARGLWVLCEGSQRVLEHPDRVALLLADAEALGVTDLFVQVYRGGRAWFRSSLADAVPWQATRRPDGTDALGALIAAAHERGLRVHAWVNVLSLASNREAPILAALGRDAAIVDQKGRSVLDYPELEVPPPDRAWLRMGTPAVWLDPAVPGVAERLVATFQELVRGYPTLDGIHFDYIRYADTLPFAPGTRFGVGLGFGFGEPSRARFEAETGLVAPFGTSLANADRWDTWRREKLTELVARLAATARAARPGLRVSAAVISDHERAYRVDLQDWLGWLDAGHLDFAVPMLYTRDPALLRYGVESYAGLGRQRELWVGLGSWLFAATPAQAVAQLRVASGEPHLATALFSWDSIRETPELLSALATDVARGRTAASP